MLGYFFVYINILNNTIVNQKKILKKRNLYYYCYHTVAQTDTTPSIISLHHKLAKNSAGISSLSNPPPAPHPLTILDLEPDKAQSNESKRNGRS
jgi:hypothetical protein